jgi:hypothetical protein
MRAEFHIVCEGVTDFEIIGAIIDELARETGLRMRAKPLFPKSNASNAGWGNLKLWIQNQASSLAGNQNRMLAAQALGATPAPLAAKSLSKGDKIGAAIALTGAFVIIQLDTDIAEFLAPDVGLAGHMLLPLCPSSRRVMCERALDAWLGGHIHKKGRQIHYCLSSLAIENWLLAAFPPSGLAKLDGYHPHHDYDEIHCPDAFLGQLGFPLDAPGKLKKTQASYRRYASSLVAALPKARGRSTLLNRFCETVAGVAAAA